RRTAILDHVGAGKTVAYASDAGTPLIADPGYRLVGACHDRGFQVHTAPGPSAVTASLALGGLPTDRFLFAGFLPARKSARRRELETLSQVPATLVVFETGRRLAATLADISAVFGEAHTVCVARELTKRFEEVKTRPVSALISDLGETGDPKGEIVLLIDRLPAGHDAADVAERAEMLVAAGLADGQSVRDVADEVSGQTGLPRKAVYHMALSLSNAGR
ncbi:MAG: 16S rRNA (cytidine(1402)-2'-O)-methyltransferase, partial [Pseudomonadota bacterium]